MNNQQQEQTQQQQHQHDQDFHQAVINNNVELVNSLLHLVDINTPNTKKQPALYHTIMNQQWKIAQLLIEHKAVFTHSSWSDECKKVVPNILHYAIQDETVDESFIDFLLSQTPTIHIEQKDQYCSTPILTSARHGNIRILKYLIGRYNPNVHVTSSNNNCNLFHYAISSNEKCTVELLDTISSLGVDINVISNINTGLKRKASPLTFAIYLNSSFKIIQKLVELGADIITKDDIKYNPQGDTPNRYVQSHLFKAIEFDDDYKLFNYLIESCPNPSQIPFKSILQHVFNNGNIESIQLIIEKYRVKFDQDQLKINLFQSTFKELHSIGAFFQSHKFSIQTQMIEYLLGQNVQNCFDFIQSNSLFRYKTSTLLILSQYSNTTLRLLQLMVENGANVHDVCHYGETVLHKLCHIHNDVPPEDIISKMDYFISMGVDVNYNINPTTTKSIITPLHVACTNERFAPKLVPHFIQHHNADITLCDNFKRLPLHNVFQPELVPLLSSPLTINSQDCSGSTPLLVCIKRPMDFNSSTDDYYQVIFNLINCGANVNIPCHHHDYPIHIIFDQNFFQYQPINVIKLLIKQIGINLNIINLSKVTPLHVAIDRFIDHGGSSKIQPSFHETMRLKAIQSIKLLLQYNADVTIQTSTGYTLLHYIVMNVGNIEIDVDEDEIDDETCITTVNDDLIEDCMVAIIDGIIDQVVMK